MIYSMHDHRGRLYCDCGVWRHIRGESIWCYYYEEEPVAEYPNTDESAWGKQEGGDHYKNLPIQPSEFIYKNNMNWLAGSVVKYVSRYQLKGNPLGDLQKARHYLDMLIEEQEKEQ